MGNDIYYFYEVDRGSEIQVSPEGALVHALIFAPSKMIMPDSFFLDCLGFLSDINASADLVTLLADALNYGLLVPECALEMHIPPVSSFGTSDQVPAANASELKLEVGLPATRRLLRNCKRLLPVRGSESGLCYRYRYKNWQSCPSEQNAYELQIAAQYYARDIRREFGAPPDEKMTVRLQKVSQIALSGSVGALTGSIGDLLPAHEKYITVAMLGAVGAVASAVIMRIPVPRHQVKNSSLVTEYGQLVRLQSEISRTWKSYCGDSREGSVQPSGPSRSSAAPITWSP